MENNISLSLSRLGLFQVLRQVVETAAGADLRIKSLKGGGDYGLTRIFVKDASNWMCNKLFNALTHFGQSIGTTLSAGNYNNLVFKEFHYRHIIALAEVEM